MSEVDRTAEASMARAAEALYAAVAARLGAYVEQLVLDRLAAGHTRPSEDQQAAAATAGRLAEAEVLPGLAALLRADLDEQRATPLEVVRRAVPPATAVLDRLGATQVPQDRFQQDRFPDDRYGLVPASLAVLGEDVAELAVEWGAAKAMAHRRRHLRSRP